jgi:crotonobetaine/carnitine-CoA ligase
VIVFNCEDLSTEDLFNENEIKFGKLSDNVCAMFTSGTSGPSKGVMMPNAHCVLFAIGTIENYNLKHHHNFYISLPLFHANGLFMQLLACLMTGR